MGSIPIRSRQLLPLVITPFIFALSSSAGHAQHWRIQAGVGLAYNAPVPLTIEQREQPPVRLRARFATRALAQPLYYLLRLDRRNAEESWGVELLHHKLYLRNAPPGVQRFQVSHGFNLLTLLHSRDQGFGSALRAGVGIVVAHPESTIRGRKWPETGGVFGGYYISGPTVQFSVAQTEELHGYFGALGEAKLIGAYARMPVVEGTATLWHLSGHAVAGLTQAF